MYLKLPVQHKLNKTGETELMPLVERQWCAQVCYCLLTSGATQQSPFESQCFYSHAQSVGTLPWVPSVPTIWHSASLKKEN